MLKVARSAFALIVLTLLTAPAAAQVVYDPGMPFYPYMPQPQPPVVDENALPAEVKELTTQFAREAAVIQQEAQKKTDKLRRELIAKLKPLQDKYTREAKLDEAVAIRDKIRALQAALGSVKPDPGTMISYIYKGETEGSFLFRVTGRAHGFAWGTDLYTADSTIAVAAVHAGVLKAGETGVVRVTLASGAPRYEGSTRNGATSYPWPQFNASYRVERGGEEE